MNDQRGSKIAKLLISGFQDFRIGTVGAGVVKIWGSGVGRSFEVWGGGLDGGKVGRWESEKAFLWRTWVWPSWSLNCLEEGGRVTFTWIFLVVGSAE